MPTYQYVCKDCNEPLEVVQSFSDDALTECPACGGNLRKVYGAVGVVFKGSGFYRNDSRDSKSSTVSASSNSSSDSSSSTTSTSDSSSSTSSTPASTPAPAAAPAAAASSSSSSSSSTPAA